MVIYLDLVIILTIVVHVLIIEGINAIFNEKIKIVRVIISSLLAVFLLSLYILPIGKFVWIRYLLGIPIGLIAFPKDKLVKRIIKIVFYYLLNLALVGTLAVFKIHNLFFLLICTLLVVVLGIITSFRNSYEKEVFINKVRLNALYDSGNASYYLNKPIIYLDQKYYSSIYQKVSKCEIKNIVSSTFVDIYNGPKIKIGRNDYEVYYAFINIDDYDLILHKDLGGVKCLNC